MVYAKIHKKSTKDNERNVFLDIVYFLLSTDRMFSSREA